MAKKADLYLPLGGAKTEYIKSYWEPELRDYVQGYADRNGMKFSQAVRVVVIEGIKALGGTVEYTP